MPLNSGKGKEPLVKIATAPNETVANLWKDVLAENGIQCLLKSVDLLAYTSPIAIQYQILVLASDEEKAREVLTPFLEGDE